MSSAERSRAGERRRERRTPAEIAVSLTSPESGEPLSGVTRNISGSGAYLLLSEPLPLFSRYQAHLVIPTVGPGGEADLEDVDIIAIVVRLDTTTTEESGGETQYSIALYFERMSPRSRQVILDYVDSTRE